jgi:glycine/D-amino acid oxidase-like deaminating enzyme
MFIFAQKKRQMLSFWEKQSFLEYDLVVLGSGIAGLSTAISFKEKNPAKRILILERGIFPYGASTKNAGFACYGSAAEIWHDIGQLGLNRALSVVEMRVKGMQKLRQRLGDEAIGYEENGGGEIFRHEDVFESGILPELNRLLYPFFSKTVFEKDPEGGRSLGFQTQHIAQFIWNHAEGQIDTGRMMRSLLSLARQKGIELITGAEASLPEQKSTGWKIPLENGPMVFDSEKIAVCTNAFAAKLFPDQDISPGRGQVLITKPIENLKWKGIFHFDEGYYYFRNVGQRVLFGGGRNLDFEGETTFEQALNPAIQQKLEYYLKTLILPENQAFEIEDRWAGIMAFGKEKVPIIKNFGNGLVAGVRMNGMGIAIGTEVGEQLALMLSEI